MRRNSSHTKQDRRGILLSIELILVLPILLLVLLAFVEFSLITTAHARVDNIAAAASRQLLSVNQSTRQIQQTINEMLGQKFAQGAFAEIDIPETKDHVGRIRIMIPMQNVTPDLLWMTGFSVRGRFVVGEAALFGQLTGVVQK